MSERETPLSGKNPQPVNREEYLAALFAQMVVQQANMATIFLGKAPHPHTDRTEVDLEGARLFIDQLEMLEAKTKGNLSKEEEMLLRQTLMQLRLEFVEAAQSPAPAATPASPPEGGATPAPAAESVTGAARTPEEESRKKFSKKY